MMPIVTESSNSDPRSFTVAKTGSASSAVSLLDGRHRNQTGYRSGPLSEEERRGLENLPLKSSDTVSYIQHLDEEQRDLRSITSLRHKDRVWPVNDRDYTEQRYWPTGFNLAYEHGSYPWTPVKWIPQSIQGCMGVASFTTAVFPTLPSDSSIESMAADMLRRSRPPEKMFDLARFIGESREFPMLWKLATTVPKSRRELGGNLLGLMFGVQPTGSDLGSMAELVLRSDQPIIDFLSNEKVREKKFGTRVLSKTEQTGEIPLTSFSTAVGGDTWLTGQHRTKLVYAAKYGTSGSNSNVIAPLLRWSYTRKQLLRTFATWEYFVPQPTDFQGRLASYRKKAELLLSSASVKESTVWELTPWTWLTDWFVDVGGLLQYQQAVRDNQIVASACGYSVWEEYIGHTQYAEATERPGYGVYPKQGARNIRFTPVKASTRYLRHKRRRGNPYSIGPSWNLTTQQWTILSTLGLAKGPNSPHIRV